MFTILFFLIVGALIFLFYRRPRAGLYLVVACAPFLGLTLDFSAWGWSRNLPLLGNTDGPLADFLALLLLATVVFKEITRRGWKNFWRETRLLLGKTGFCYLLPFWLVALLSLTAVPRELLGTSFKYFLRPIVFFYLAWVALPFFITDAEKTFKKLLATFLGVGFAASLLGWLSLLSNETFWPVWRRLAPTGWGKFAPLTYNHNILAEVLVAVIPLAFWFFESSLKNKKNQKLFFLLFAFISLTALLTFSRAAWLALFFEFILYFWFRRRTSFLKTAAPLSLKTISKKIAAAILLLSPFIIYMIIFSLSSVVTSSNTARWDMTRVSWTYFQEHPWLGNGIGTFVPLLADTRLFTVEYGDPLDAHGIIQKLLAEVGLLGIISFFIYAGWALYSLRQEISQEKNEERKKLKLALFLAVAGCFVFQLFNTSYFNQHLWLPVGLALAAKKIYGQKD
ncbi:MAG: O-antigen ligase family protein [Candidatus Magasanikbacteria bacterium]|nr:O-antigen ligase family protein [Candidatus Magasanikbacteria bacterium]